MRKILDRVFLFLYINRNPLTVCFEKNGIYNIKIKYLGRKCIITSKNIKMHMQNEDIRYYEAYLF